MVLIKRSQGIRGYIYCGRKNSNPMKKENWQAFITKRKRLEGGALKLSSSHLKGSYLTFTCAPIFSVCSPSVEHYVLNHNILHIHILCSCYGKRGLFTLVIYIFQPIMYFVYLIYSGNKNIFSDYIH